MSDGPAEQRRRRAPRRAVAAPTNPAADQADEVPPARDHERKRGREAGRAPRRLDPRDTWILEQRPPHWD
ncbi:hypothetical protein [Serinicoccus hydrothermalis]|uniref:hypothetical protein n=1 Tax=Serinicoccus hydrothermalis TaxID=1758689 RepID=UPI000833C151|nr:hypothetical protein [Serinicoccus hydrothermalis]